MLRVIAPALEKHRPDPKAHFHAELMGSGRNDLTTNKKALHGKLQESLPVVWEYIISGNGCQRQQKIPPDLSGGGNHYVVGSAGFEPTTNRL